MLDGVIYKYSASELIFKFQATSKVEQKVKINLETCNI